jgi:hypothetical protein
MTDDEIKQARAVIEGINTYRGCISQHKPPNLCHKCDAVRMTDLARFRNAARTGWPAALDALDNAINAHRGEIKVTNAAIDRATALECERDQLKAEVERLQKVLAAEDSAHAREIADAEDRLDHQRKRAEAWKRAAESLERKTVTRDVNGDPVFCMPLSGSILGTSLAFEAARELEGKS